MFFKLGIVATVAAAFGSSLASTISVTRTLPVARNGLSLNPSIDTLVSSKTVDVSTRDLTNGERLARGLPLKAPARRIRPRQPAPSNVPISGRLKVVNSETEEFIGYVSKDLNAFGEVGVDNDPENAFDVSFTASSDGSSFDVSIDNSDFPYLGFVEGFANTGPDLGTGTFNYVYLALTTQVPPESPPVTQPNSFTAVTSIDETVESAVWTYDQVTSKLTPKWINTDGTAFSSQELVYYATDNVVVLTGDYGLFTASFGDVPKVSIIQE